MKGLSGIVVVMAWVFCWPAGAAERRGPWVTRAPFEWLEIHEGDVREIPDSFEEASLRMQLIARAEHTIDIVQYLQTNDGPVGLPLASALRDAANRGVRVRFLVTGTPELETDPLRRFAHHLLARPTREPIRFLEFGPASPWSIWDSFHEKFIIVDGKWAVTGGRAYGFTYLSWLDDGFITRGGLARQVQETYERIWSFASSRQAPRTTPPLAPGDEPPRFRHYRVPPMMALSPVQATDEASFLDWLGRAPEPAAPVTGRARVIHYDLSQQRWMNHFPRNVAAREAQLEDPIAAELVARISDPGTKEVWISSMSLIELPALKSALIRAAQGGIAVTMLTNCRQSDAILAPFGLNWRMSVPDMLELARVGVRIEAIEPGARSDWRYLHKKMAVVDDTVFVGSHNFNLPSSLYNDEADLEIEDPAFARSVRQHLESQMQAAFRPVEVGELEEDLRRPGPPGVRNVLGWLGREMMPLF